MIVNGCKPLTIITKRSILDVAATVDPPLKVNIKTILWHQLGVYDLYDSSGLIR